jgi:hypothetical protein
VAREHYEIRIKGRLSASLKAALAEMTVRAEPVETVLSGQIEDQAKLYGVLQHIQSLGLELLEVRRVVVDELPSSTLDRESSQQ